MADCPIKRVVIVHERLVIMIFILEYEVGCFLIVYLMVYSVSYKVHFDYSYQSILIDGSATLSMEKIWGFILKHLGGNQL